MVIVYYKYFSEVNNIVDKVTTSNFGSDKNKIIYNKAVNY